ncbi:MAG: hypothetical protein MPJ24_06625 [Pirellulaceae bacterium]|nr:hypothetical protein [Pirellulaceae bacterium]
MPRLDQRYKFNRNPIRSLVLSLVQNDLQAKILEPFLKLPKHEQKPIIDEVIGQNRFLQQRYERSATTAIERELVGYLEENQIRLSS